MSEKTNMTDYDEKEISCCTYMYDEESENCLALLRNADRNAQQIAKNIIQLKKNLSDLQNAQEITDTTERETCDLKSQLKQMIEEHRNAIEEVLKLAKMINFDVNNLECRKIDIDEGKTIDNCNYPGTWKADEDIDGDIAPVIVLNNATHEPKFLLYGENHVETKCCENDNCKSNSSTCTEESYRQDDCKNCDAHDNNNNNYKNNNHNHNNNNDNNNDDNNNNDDDDDDNNNNGNKKNANHCCCQFCVKPVTEDFEKNVIRDNLMFVKGEMKLLNQLNRDLLSQLESANHQTVVKSNSLRDQPHLKKCKQHLVNSFGTKSANTQALTGEITRLRKELLEVKRDQRQIELAKKILNVSDSQCANCAGSTNKIELEKLIKKYNNLLADHNAKLLEIRNLQCALNETKQCMKNCEDSLMISKTQVSQLEKKLFDLNSNQAYDREVICSNDKYLIENLRFRLQKATDEKTNMEMIFDFYLSELEDQKSKYMEALQFNEELKYRIETLTKEKDTISKEYETEFDRMNENLKARMNEIETLPALLANMQQELEKERSMRMIALSERDALSNDINELRTTLACEENANDSKRVKDLEEENKQLKAMIMTLDDTLADHKRKYTEHVHYSLQLKEQLNMVRQEAAVQVTKTKDFTECQKNKYNEYIKTLEHKLAECRALACSEYKKREHIDERLRNRIEVLTKNLNEADKKITELLNAQRLMESKMGEELCKVPLTLKPSCKDFNFMHHWAKPNDNN